jgi:hypothetical protein
MANKYMEKCPMFILIKKMQIKMRLRFHLTPVRMAVIKKTTHAGEDVRKKTLDIVGGNIN